MSEILLLLALFLAPTERELVPRLAEELFGSKARVEVTLADGSRADIMVPGPIPLAVEVDWAGKWQQSIGQSLWYSIVSNSKPCVVLILEGKRSDKLHVARCAGVCERAGIVFRTWRLP